jgi:hypothetical protein
VELLQMVQTAGNQSEARKANCGLERIDFSDLL